VEEKQEAGVEFSKGHVISGVQRIYTRKTVGVRRKDIWEPSQQNVVRRACKKPKSSLRLLDQFLSTTPRNTWDISSVQQLMLLKNHD
jgi:hypothetical protein